MLKRFREVFPRNLPDSGKSKSHAKSASNPKGRASAVVDRCSRLELLSPRPISPCVAHLPRLVDLLAREANVGGRGDSVPIGNAIPNAILLAAFCYFPAFLRRVVFVGEAALRTR
ncbi:hypothetical protein [Methylocystis sp.]|uniref:hypothetical protein n=1 Tax=Methylocystis sp. TaxID=1911079 RepID=UPI0025D95FF7|nr:hypothetical protein [Methylocystis sp.]